MSTAVFPHTIEQFHQGREGMYLRDYFAAAALQGLLASPTTDEDTNWSVLANCSYDAADAMMKAREQ
jgi:hypothetical protein